MSLDATVHKHVPMTAEQWAEHVAYRGYKQRQLEAAFKLVQPVGNWKMKIDARVPYAADSDEVKLICASIDYFTGGLWKVTPVGASETRIKAPGYYAVIGA